MLEVTVSSQGQYVAAEIAVPLGKIQIAQLDELGSLIFAIAVGACIFLFPSTLGTSRAVSFFLIIVTYLISTFLLVSTTNVAAFLFLWEFTALSAWGIGKLGMRGSNPVLGAIPVNAVGGLSSLAMFAFVGLMASQNGSFEIGALKASSPSLMMGLLLAAIVLKSFGLLSTAWTEGAGRAFPVSNALLAGGAVTAVGLYPFLRFGGTIMVQSGDAQSMALWTFLAIALIFALASLRELDVYRVAAHVAFSQFCLVLAGFSLPRGQFAPDFLYTLIACSLASMVLFLAIGLVSEHSGARNLLEMGGLAQRQPALALVLVVAVIAAAGLPPFAPFAAKITTSFAMFAQTETMIAVAWVASWVAMSLALFRVLALALFPPLAPADETGKTNLFSMVPIALGLSFLLFAALSPGVVLSYLKPALSGLALWQ